MKVSYLYSAFLILTLFACAQSNGTLRKICAKIREITEQLAACKKDIHKFNSLLAQLETYEELKKNAKLEREDKKNNRFPSIEDENEDKDDDDDEFIFKYDISIKKEDIIESKNNNESTGKRKNNEPGSQIKAIRLSTNNESDSSNKSHEENYQLPNSLSSTLSAQIGAQGQPGRQIVKNIISPDPLVVTTPTSQNIRWSQEWAKLSQDLAEINFSNFNGNV